MTPHTLLAHYLHTHYTHTLHTHYTHTTHTHSRTYYRYTRIDTAQSSHTQQLSDHLREGCLRLDQRRQRAAATIGLCRLNPRSGHNECTYALTPSGHSCTARRGGQVGRQMGRRLGTHRQGSVCVPRQSHTTRFSRRLPCPARPGT